MTDVYAPLYEAKMLSFFDHRAADSVAGGGLQRQTVPAYLTNGDKEDPGREVTSLYWVDSNHIAEALPTGWEAKWFTGWADVTSATNARTFTSCCIPGDAAANNFALALPNESWNSPLMLGIFSTLAFDFIARNKLGGVHLNFFIVKQLPCPTPAQLDSAAPWRTVASVADEIRDRVRELMVTSWRMTPFARDMGDFGSPFRWLPERREQIRAELDAMMFHVYGLDRDEVSYVLDTFTVMRKYDERDHGEFRTKRLVLEYYDLLASSIASGVGYVTPISPMPGDGPRHDVSTRPDWLSE